MGKSIFTWHRFDLAIKDIFIDLLEKDTSFGREIYKEHLRVWNGFKEPGNPKKTSFKAFESHFIQIHEDMKAGNFDWERSPIEINEDGYLINGAHRLTASNQQGFAPIFAVKQTPNPTFYDYRYFKRKGLSDPFMDAAALQMVRKNDDLRMIHIFPGAAGGRDKLELLIHEYTDVAYHREVELNSNGAFRYTMELYKGEEWAGSWGNDFAGFRTKAQACFPAKGPLSVYWVDLPDLGQARELKEKIRDIYKIGNHSVHINDTHEETLRLSRALLNFNSVRFLNYAKLVKDSKFSSLVDEFEKYIEENDLDFEDYCITASGVLSLFGLRKANDLDYIHSNHHIISNPSKRISSHNDYGLALYTTSYDEIIFNPANHFYFGNLKVAAIDVVKDLKQKRGERKDLTDLKLLSRIHNQSKLWKLRIGAQQSLERGIRKLKLFSNVVLMFLLDDVLPKSFREPLRNLRKKFKQK